MKQRKLVVSASLLGLILWAGAAGAFVPERTSNGLPIVWNLTALGGAVPYLINRDRPTEAVCPLTNLPGSTVPDALGGSDAVTVLQNSFAHWLAAAIPTTVVDVSFGGTTGNDVFGTSDGSNVLLFIHCDPDLAGGVLALTINWYATATGLIQETDIAFNDDYDWRTDGSANPPDSYELAPVAIHEMGHFFGLDHSFIANVGGVFDPTIACTMYPYYFGLDAESLEPDDIAGITTLYPDVPAQTAAFGAIEGRVTSWPNLAMFGIHVVAITETGKVPTVSQPTSINGRYRIDGVPPGNYYVYIESPSVQSSFWTTFVGPYWTGVDKISQDMLYRHIKVPSAAALVDGNAIFNRATLVTVTAGTTRSEINFMVGGAAGTNKMLAFDFDSNSGGCGQLAGAAGPAGMDLALWLLPPALLLALRIRRYVNSRR